MSADPDAALTNLREAFQRGEVRIELSVAFMADGSAPCARLYVRGDKGRWVKVDAPMLLPHEGGSRADLLRDLAALSEDPS